MSAGQRGRSAGKDPVGDPVGAPASPTRKEAL